MAKIKGGDKLEKVLAQIAAKLSGGERLKVGFLEGATYPDGTPVGMIAAIQDYGAPRAGIPSRPFFRNMIAAKSEEWPAIMTELLKANDYNVKITLTLMGEGIAGQLQQSILDTNTPPLKESTIKAKGFAKPLTDTNHMHDSVKFQVI